MSFPIIASMCKSPTIIFNATCKHLKETLHVDNSLTLMVAPLAPHEVLLDGFSSLTGAYPVASSWNIFRDSITEEPESSMHHYPPGDPLFSPPEANVLFHVLLV